MNANVSFRRLLSRLGILSLIVACLVACLAGCGGRDSNTAVKQDELTSFLEQNPEAREYEPSE